jgi:hypothetical protein
VRLKLTWPERAKLRDVKVRVQTELRGSWRVVPIKAGDSPPESLPLGIFEKPTPVAYQVEASLQDGQEVELWGYFQVKGTR